MAQGPSPIQTERRAAIEMRAAGRRLEGYAAVFNTEAPIGRFIEVIRPGAFTASLAARADIVALVDHDRGRLLGRTRAGTLRLSEDSRGLAFDLDLPETTLGRDILALAERGDIGGASFAFRATDEAWPTPGRRELRAVHLLDVSIVHSFPAYSQTAVTARDRAHADAPAGSAALRRLRLALL